MLTKDLLHGQASLARTVYLRPCRLFVQRWRLGCAFTGFVTRFE